MRLYKYIYEGIEDKGIFKAAFMIGNAGSGKSYSINKIKSGQIEPRIVNTDKYFNLFDKDDWNNKWNKIRNKITTLSLNNLYLYLNSMLPLFIDSTSSDPNNLVKRKKILENIGYDTGAIFISTSLDTSIKRTEERAKEMGRKVDKEFVIKSWEKINMLKKFYKTKFKLFLEIKNDDGLFTEDIIIKSYNKISKFFISPVLNSIGQKNINILEENNQKYLVPLIYSKNELMDKIQEWY